MTASARRVAIVTGAAHGIGQAIALALAPDHDVVVHCRRDLAAARTVAEQVGRRGGSAEVVAADLEDERAPRRIVDAALDRFGRVDVLVANAAAGSFRNALDTSRAQADRTLRTIVSSFGELAATAGPQLGAGGRVVVVSGHDAAYAVPRHAFIGAAKAALEALVRHLAVELGPHGVTVNAVRPGPIRTRSTDRWLAGAPDQEAALLRAIPAGRLGSPDDVAAVVGFLVSPAAGYVSGAVIPIDGALAAGGGPWAELA